MALFTQTLLPIRFVVGEKNTRSEEECFFFSQSKISYQLTASILPILHIISQYDAVHNALFNKNENIITR